MVDMTYPELNSDLGTTTADGLRNVANTARSFACNLYQNSPAAAIGVDPTGIGQFNNALWSKLCAPTNQLPLPPAPPFNGGQCDELYNLTLSVLGGAGDEPDPATDTRTFNNVQGPMKGWAFRPIFGDDNNIEVVFFTANQELSFGSKGRNGFTPQVSVDSITPVDGTDQCGNPPPSFPPDAAPIIEVETNLNVDFGGLTVNVPVSFQPIVNVVTNVFIPVISVNVGPINVQFSPGGVTFSPTFAPDIDVVFSPSLDPRPLPPSPKPPVKPSECPEVDLDPVIDKLDDLQETANEIKECACQPEKERRVLTFGAANSRNVTVPKGEIVSARLNAVSVGNRVRGQYGGGGAPDVEFLGWCAFGQNGTGGNRLPVQYLNSYFAAPPEVTSFSYTLQDSSTATLTIEYDVEVDPPTP